MSAGGLHLAARGARAVKPRPASTVVVLSETSKTSPYRALFMKRSAKSGFMASRFVFPGGVREAADSLSSDWASLFDAAKYNVTARALRLRDGEQVSDRIAAVRELFEETGVLLATRRKATHAERVERVSTIDLSEQHDDKTLQELRHQVHAEPSFFLQLCRDVGMVPDIARLEPWARWVTPVVEKRRYDTWFYVAVLESGVLPQGVLDLAGESVKNAWYSPSEALALAAAHKIALPPPTTYVLTEMLSHCPRVDDVLAEARARVSIVPMLPQIVAGEHGVAVCLPGDKEHEDSAGRGRHRVVLAPGEHAWEVHGVARSSRL